MRAATQHFLFSGVEEILSQYLFFASPFKMATTFFKRLAKATPIVFSNAFGCQSSSTFTVPFGAMAALSGGISFFYYFSSPTVVHLDQINEHPGPKIALNSDKWIEFKLQDTARVSHNTQLFRFSFDPTAKLGLDIASCILTRAPMAQDTEGKTKYIIRPYTPISDPDAKGYFDFLIKIAGGSGITPMLKVVEAILKNQDDDTQVSLLYANVSPDDILLKQKLDSLAVSHPNFKVFYTVDNPSKNWRGGAGYISKDMVVKGLPSPSDDTLILVCGPPGMMKHVSGDKAEDRSQGEVLNSIYCDPFGFKGLHLNWNCITCYVH
ncbi:NADH-cytochrome b5 reductase-like protein isoform X5 [Tripterygium wilfordii]|uniref:NADH-cytochrome b5 reductase-like protein isoform X5 n=1 Tax=Tripterygium wilfordii TaxID=458696 RepID=UPI0018F85591|nr:NADH-cytochrome b5 reductase-like protein isoform X5 [Tripterygium wilfordii]